MITTYTGITEVPASFIVDLISNRTYASLTQNDLRGFQDFIERSDRFWAGIWGGEVVCCAGVIEGSWASKTAYFWLHHTTKLGRHALSFLRDGKGFADYLKSEYAMIHGVTTRRSMRWLAWLGAEFENPDDAVIQFIIRGN